MAVSSVNCEYGTQPDSTWYKVKWPEGRIKVGIRREEGWVRVEARNLLDLAGHRLT